MEDNTLFRHSEDIRAAFELTADRGERDDTLRRHNVSYRIAVLSFLRPEFKGNREKYFLKLRYRCRIV